MIKLLLFKEKNIPLSTLRESSKNIILLLVYNFLLFTLLANAENSDGYLLNIEIMLLGFTQELRMMITRNMNIDNPAAGRTNQMVMRMSIGIKSSPFATDHQGQLGNITAFFKQFHGVVNRRQGHVGELLRDMLKNFFGAGVRFIVFDEIVDGYSLRGSLRFLFHLNFPSHVLFFVTVKI